MRANLLRLTLVAALVLGLMATAAISIGAPVRIRATAENRWNPDFQHVTPGTRVVWVNPERIGRRHHLAAYGRGWSKDVLLDPGERTGKRFRREGVFKYRCRLHSHLQDGQCHGMCGVVHVER